MAFDFGAALQSFGSAGSAFQDARDIQRQRAVEWQTQQDEAALRKLKLQEGKQNLQLNLRDEALKEAQANRGVPFLDPVKGEDGKYYQNVLTTKGLSRILIPDYDPLAEKKASIKQVRDMYSGLGFSDQEIKQLEAEAGGFKLPVGETEYQRAQMDYREKVLALQKAKFDASQNPNSPATKAALMRANQEAIRSQAYMIRAQAAAFGSYNGEPLPGALETEEGKPIGSQFAGNYFKSQQGLSQLNDAYGAIKSVGSSLQSLYTSGGSLNQPNVAAALANPTWTPEKLLQGIAGKTLTPQQQEAVVAIKSAQENIQAMRKAAGGGLSNEQVNRLEAQLPGPNTPNFAYAQRQLSYLNQTLKRLSSGVPAAVGGQTFEGGAPRSPSTSIKPSSQKVLVFNPITGKLE